MTKAEKRTHNIMLWEILQEMDNPNADATELEEARREMRDKLDELLADEEEDEHDEG